jgi:hypothetical protein
MDMAANPAINSIGFAGSPGSVSAVVELVQAELDSLLARREEIRKRIQNLHKVIYGLQQFGRLDTNDLRSESPNPASRRRTNHRTSSGIAVDEHATGELRSCVRSNTKYVHPALRRACRIALLEGQAAASVKEIHARIVRRYWFMTHSNLWSASRFLYPSTTSVRKILDHLIPEGRLMRNRSFRALP